MVEGPQPPSPPSDAAPGVGVGYRLVGHALAIVAVLAAAFMIQLTVLGNLEHGRDQSLLAAAFRIELAKGIAPVGPVDDANVPLARGAPVAVLEIPALHVREVVVEGTTSGTLMAGPGHRRDTPFPGQTGTSVIAGRRATYGGPFRSIDRLRPGDEIIATTGQGRSSFVVLGVRHAGDPVPPAPTAGGGQLTLVTTDGPAFQPTDALRVDAALVGEALSGSAPLSSRALLAAEATFAGDSSALPRVIWWSMVLAVAGVAAVWVCYRVGSWQAWMIAVPTLLVLGLTVADDVVALLPNLL